LSNVPAGGGEAVTQLLWGCPMRTLRRFHGHLQGRIQAVSVNHPSVVISIILGAYLSLQIVAPAFIAG
jgi:hypothetical protein